MDQDIDQKFYLWGEEAMSSEQHDKDTIVWDKWQQKSFGQWKTFQVDTWYRVFWWCLFEQVDLLPLFYFFVVETTA